jgi:hypothetical protein
MYTQIEAIPLWQPVDHSRVRHTDRIRWLRGIHYLHTPCIDCRLASVIGDKVARFSRIKRNRVLGVCKLAALVDARERCLGPKNPSSTMRARGRSHGADRVRAGFSIAALRGWVMLSLCSYTVQVWCHRHTFSPHFPQLLGSEFKSVLVPQLARLLEFGGLAGLC